MGAFEDFVNANLGIRKPLIFDFAPPTGAGKSLKAAGIRGAHFLDLNTNFLYEKTGENNNVDWVKIAKLGDSRGEPGGTDTNIQFVSGDKLAGSEHLIYNYENNQLSGTSGHFDYFTADDAVFSNDVHVSGDLHISGKTYVNEILDYTVTGTISGHSGIYHYLQSDYITGNTGHFLDEVIVGEAGEDDGIILDGGNIIAGGNFEMSGDLVVSGRNVIEGLDEVSGFAKSGIDRLQGGLGEVSGFAESGISGLRDGLSGVSGFAESGISGLNDNLISVSGESLANFVALGDDIDILEDDLLIVSGESLANTIALSDDITIVSDDVVTVSGLSTANFVALSDDVSLINSSLPFLFSLEIPQNISSSGIKFLDLGNNVNYIIPPQVHGNMTSTGSVAYIYDYYIHDITTTGFHIDFSDVISESGHSIDLAIFKKA